MQDNTAHNWPILICLLGDFRLLVGGQPVAVANGAKAKTLLSTLGLRTQIGVPRDTLLGKLWPDSDTTLASQSLYSLVHSLHKQLGDAIGGAAPIVHANGGYHLNRPAGVSVDVARFIALADEGNRDLARGHVSSALDTYEQATHLYQGDLWTGTDDNQALVEREVLRARYLSLLATLAEHAYRRDDYIACMAFAQRILLCDPCREDAHRLAMRCYVRQGQRIAALRQYQLCVGILQGEFDMAPEPATETLYDQVRFNPAVI